VPAPFTPKANLFARLSVGLGLLAVVAISAGAFAFVRSPFRSGVGVAVPQPVPFSHDHHVRGLGIDCRYCHTTVETEASAGMPPTSTCMNCHWAIWTQADALAPVRDSWKAGEPLRWRRVHNLPDFVYFDHSIHVAKGVHCQTCHGRVDQMRSVSKSHTLYMQWCLECHRNPERFIGDPKTVFEFTDESPGATRDDQHKLLKQNQVDMTGLTDCSTCHR
jgi:hypothetical protein